jgi:DNA-binding transcriptional regulator LsrR (DeoR family)
MPRPRKINHEMKLLIALMHSERKMNNVEIGGALEISESAVSKVLRECFDQGRLRLVFDPQGLTEQELLSLQAAAGTRNELTQQISRFRKDSSAVVTEPDVRVFESGSAETTPKAWAARLQAFGEGVAPYVMHLIATSRFVGTSWGETLASVIRALEARPVQRPKSPIHFVPLCGEMLDGPPRKASASNLSYRLDEIVNGDLSHSHSYWLAGVPSHAPIPETQKIFSEEQTAVICRYIRRSPAYRKIFGADSGDSERPASSDAPLIDRLDMILSSCGPKERPLGYDGVQWLKSTRISSRDARGLIAGDISGVLLPTRESSKVAAINRAWMGARLDHLRQCARRALGASLPGVVLCAIGANKADSVMEIIRLGLANRLVVDTDLWQQLQRKL